MEGFISEEKLKEVFWRFYNNKNRAIKYAFEYQLGRDGATDLVTIEKYQGNYQINSFEFKLNDINKVFLQAEANMDYSNKSWIVIPSNKEKIINDKWLGILKKLKYVGVISVEREGRYKIIYQPNFKQNIKFNQAILNLAMD